MINILEKMLEDFDYNKLYDFDDMKLAIVCRDFLVDELEINDLDYEDIITLAKWVKNIYLTNYNDLSFEEQGYIQSFAKRILNEYEDKLIKIFKKENKNG